MFTQSQCPIDLLEAFQQNAVESCIFPRIIILIVNIECLEAFQIVLISSAKSYSEVLWKA